jgi:hypothetical protein
MLLEVSVHGQSAPFVAGPWGSRVSWWKDVEDTEREGQGTRHNFSERALESSLDLVLPKAPPLPTFHHFLIMASYYESTRGLIH